MNLAAVYHVFFSFTFLKHKRESQLESQLDGVKLSYFR